MLLRLAEQYDTVGPDGVRLRMRLTHEDLASLIASTRETLSKFTSEFRSQGLIDYDTKQILIRDMVGLEAQAKLA